MPAEVHTSLRLSAELLEKLDAWCAQQPLRPSRAQAIRSFVEQALSSRVVGTASVVHPPQRYTT